MEYSSWEFSGWQFSGWEFSRGEFDWWEFSGWEISEWEFSWYLLYYSPIKNLLRNFRYQNSKKFRNFTTKAVTQSIKNVYLRVLRRDRKGINKRVQKTNAKLKNSNLHSLHYITTSRIVISKSFIF